MPTLSSAGGDSDDEDAAADGGTNGVGADEAAHLAFSGSAAAQSRFASADVRESESGMFDLMHEAIKSTNASIISCFNSKERKNSGQFIRVVFRSA